MIEIIGVKFSSAGKAYYFDPNGIQAEIGTKVLVETARGVEMGKVVIPNKMVEDSEIVSPLKPIVRIATEDDFRQAEENKVKEKEAFEVAVQKIAEHKLDMKLVGAEYTFDRSKILFYFTADGRVDFRELVKSLASIFRTRIELRQIGVRDEARQLGSLGICGRFLCCSTFLNDFHPVSIKMAKEQGLSLNPTKISGVCGRLMCCLQYEQNAYEDMLSRMPKRGDRVETPDGVGIVADTATLKGQIKVKFQDENGENMKFETYVLGDFQKLDKNGKVRLERPKPKEEDVDLAEPIAAEPVPEAPVEAAEPAEGEKKEQKNKGGRNRYRNRRGKKTGSNGNPNQKKPDRGEKPNNQNKKPDRKPNQSQNNNGNGGNGGYSSGYGE